MTLRNPMELNEYSEAGVLERYNGAQTLMTRDIYLRNFANSSKDNCICKSQADILGKRAPAMAAFNAI